MVIFLLLIIWLVILEIIPRIFKVVKIKENKIKIYGGCFALWIIQALRSKKVGVDLISYLPALSIAKNSNVLQGEKIYNYEIGYIIYSKIFAVLEVNPQIYLGVVSATIIIPLGYMWLKNSKMPLLSIYIYITLGFYLFSFSGLRQAIAISITFYSYKYIKKRILLKFLMLLILAISFHKTAIIFIFAYFLYNYEIKKKKWLLYICFFINLVIFKKQIYSIIEFLWKGKRGEIVETGAQMMFLVMIIILLLSYILSKKIRRNKDFITYQNYLIMTIIIQNFASVSSVIMRVGYYYYIFITLLLPNLIVIQKNEKNRFLEVFVLLLGLFYFGYKIYASGYLNVVPYYFFWE